VSESGVFFSFSQSESYLRDTKILEKLRIISFKTLKLEIPFYQTNDPSDKGEHYIQEGNGVQQYNDETSEDVRDEIWVYFTFVSSVT
jgi:hypothetical protein